MNSKKLTNFNFALAVDENVAFKDGVIGKTVCIPHTWSIEEGTEEYCGVAWYSTLFRTDGKDYKTVLLFHAVYRDCIVYLNGCEIARHFGSGYTPFEVDITQYIQCGQNLLTLKCDNSYSDAALPHGKDFDWANDGGIIRPIELLTFGKDSVKNIQIQSEVGRFLDNGNGEATVTCNFDFCAPNHASYSVCVRESKSRKIIFEKSDLNESIITFTMADATLWSTKNPFLYTLEIKCAEESVNRNFGVRKIEVRNDKVLLNNREIILRGVEWMPGSNPNFGMAEPESELVKNLELLQDLNCNFTRFHWQQDDSVYDWCDAHGLMVQEEIPYWGAPKNAGKIQLQTAIKQADEMLTHHYNHPSILCWGVGNELGGKNKGTVAYVKEMVAYFKSKDTMRLVNYVSNSFGWRSFGQMLFGAKDATYYGDICMWNEYLGTWYGNPNYDVIFRFVKKESRGKPLMSTEFGLCEPHFTGGDERRIAIYKEKLEYYQKYGFSGWIYFSLNDYRTHVGESGKGKLKQRIHGSVDLYGNKKPSYDLIKQQNGSIKD